jgi:hypothetical protein
VGEAGKPWKGVFVAKLFNFRDIWTLGILESNLLEENMSSLTNPGKVEEFIDGYSAQQIFSSKHRRSGVTFGDCIILPGEITFGIDQLNLATKLTKNITLNLPFVSSPMDTVTEHQMATAMALQGGLGIIHCNFSIEDQV